MGGVTELLRFAIPGWLLIMYVGIFLVIRGAVGILFTGTTQSLIQTIGQHKDAIEAVTVFGAAAGLPIGYVLYQLYWWVTEHGASYAHMVPLDRGAAALQDVLISFEELVHRRYRGPIDAKYGPSRIPGLVHWIARSKLPPMKRTLHLQDNKSLANFVWHLLIQKNKAEMVRQKAESLTDVYHSLGVARVAICFAFGAYLFVESLTQVWGLQHVLALVINALILLIFFQILTTARQDSLMSLILFQHDFITFYWPRTDLVAPPGSS